MSRKIWYEFGKMLPKSTKTAKNAMQKTDLSWFVEHKKIQVVDGLEVPGKVAVVRSDNGIVLGIVNSTYKSIQNTNVFSFLDNFVQTGNATYHAAGIIGNGEKIWLLLKMNDDITLPSSDVVQKFILFSNAHDGRGGIGAYFIPLRQKSQTLLNIAFGKRVKQGIQMRHVGKVEQRIHEARKIFNLANDFYKFFDSSILKFYRSDFKQRKVDLFLSTCFENYSLDSTRTQNTLKKIRVFYEKEIEIYPSSENSAWAWFNAVVDFIDYERLSKGKDSFERRSNHLESLFWGSALLLKQKAWDSISSLIKL